MPLDCKHKALFRTLYGFNYTVFRIHRAHPESVTERLHGLVMPGVYVPDVCRTCNASEECIFSDLDRMHRQAAVTVLHRPMAFRRYQVLYQRSPVLYVQNLQSAADT